MSLKYMLTCRPHLTRCSQQAAPALFRASFYCSKAQKEVEKALSDYGALLPEGEKVVPTSSELPKLYTLIAEARLTKALAAEAPAQQKRSEINAELTKVLKHSRAWGVQIKERMCKAIVAESDRLLTES